jgi:hypothetical protein
MARRVAVICALTLAVAASVSANVLQGHPQDRAHRQPNVVVHGGRNATGGDDVQR